MPEISDIQKFVDSVFSDTSVSVEDTVERLLEFADKAEECLECLRSEGKTGARIIVTGRYD